MANFLGHLYGGAAVSSVAAMGVHSLGWSGPEQSWALFFLGVAGGLLPDIDSDSSKPVRGVFLLLGAIVAFIVSASLTERLSVLELGLIWGAIFLSVRYGLYEVFARLTVHRGIWHSLLAVVFAGLACADLCYHLAGFSAFESWLSGAFVALGYLTHLCLDEIASIDLLGNRVRRSFGTALKPLSINAPRASLLMLGAVLGLMAFAPTLSTVFETLDELPRTGGWR